jgi:hypothetical protein
MVTQVAEDSAEAAASAASAASSASAAASSASAAASSASAAAASEAGVAADADAAAASASAALTSETNASTSETNAASSATAAAGSATSAGTSATNAASSATAASSSATAAASSASAASTSETNASSSATSAATSATNATNSASAALTSETNAASSASAASGSASAAATSATNAANSASAASTSETNAASSATSAAGSASAASASADAALAALDSFDDRYLGQKSVEPTVDNDGNALVAGALYFNTVDNAMKVYDGIQWLAAYASLSGALIATNNLSDLVSASSARTNLGLGTAATTNSTAYATAAQGELADTALQPATIGVSVQGYSSVLASTTASFTTADETKLDGIEAGAQVNTVTSVAGKTGSVTLVPSDVGAEPVDATILKQAAIGVSVQGYNANTVIDASYVHTDNNFTSTLKSKLDGIEAGAEVNVNADWNAASGDAQILNKPTLGTAAATDSTAYATAAQGTKADTAYGWGNHASAGYLTSFTETDPVYVASSWYSTTNNAGNWNTAYGWGNHASAGYATSNGSNASGTWAIAISGNAATATSAGKISSTNWVVEESGGVLYFKYGGTNKAKLDSSGNLTVVGNVTAYGTV